MGANGWKAESNARLAVAVKQLTTTEERVEAYSKG
jgi:hypothetical protein